MCVSHICSLIYSFAYPAVLECLLCASAGVRVWEWPYQIQQGDMRLVALARERPPWAPTRNPSTLGGRDVGNRGSSRVTPKGRGRIMRDQLHSVGKNTRTEFREGRGEGAGDSHPETRLGLRWGTRRGKIRWQSTEATDMPARELVGMGSGGGFRGHCTKGETRCTHQPRPASVAAQAHWGEVAESPVILEKLKNGSLADLGVGGLHGQRLPLPDDPSESCLGSVFRCGRSWWSSAL